MSRPEVAERAAALRAQRVPFVHARVVRAERPTSAKPGDEAIVFTDGTLDGFVGGRCAESTVRAQALALLDSGEPLLLRIAPDGDPVDVPDDGAGNGTRTVHNPCLSGGTLEIFLEPILPLPVLAVHGDSPIARALVAVGEPLGFLVARWDADGPSDVAAVVVASHGRDEVEVLTGALRGRAPAYVGLVASRKRGAEVLAALPVDDDLRARVHTPAGLDIGARTPEEVALSILAEIIAERSRPSGRPVASADESPASATDPVCGMTVAALDSSLHLDHDGQRFHFCGSGCLRAFSAQPAGYAPA